MEFKILHRENENSEWGPVTQSEYDDESHLQELILNHLKNQPDLVPVQEIFDERDPIKIVIDEFNQLSSGSVDLIGFDKSGNVTLIEVKLQKNREARRQIVAQILDYAASLWEMDYEEIDRFFQEQMGLSLTELMDFDSSEENEEERFKENVKSQLETGDFTLFLVVDDVDDNLKRILEYLNKEEEGPSIYAVAVRYFQRENGGDEMLVPQIYGVSQKAEDRKKRKKERETWTFSKVKNEYEGVSNVASRRALELAELAKKLEAFEARESSQGPWFGIKTPSDKVFMRVTHKAEIYCHHHLEDREKRFGSEDNWRGFLNAVNNLSIFDYSNDIEINKKSQGSLNELSEDEFSELKEIVREFSK